MRVLDVRLSPSEICLHTSDTNGIDANADAGKPAHPSADVVREDGVHVTRPSAIDDDIVRIRLSELAWGPAL